MTIARRSRDDHNWQSLYRYLEFLVLPKLTLHDRSLEDIGTRALTLSEKGKVARVFDKTKDLGEVLTLVENLRQTILIYQVSARDCQSRKLLTRGTDVTTTVNIQPGRPIDRGFSLSSSTSRLS